MMTEGNSLERRVSSSPNAADDHLHSWRLVIVIGTLCLGAFLYGLDANIIGAAIPRITTDFKSLPAVAWYGASYLLTVTAFQPLFGNLYKFFNAKVVYLASLFIFESIPALASDCLSPWLTRRVPSRIYCLRLSQVIRRLDLWACSVGLWCLWPATGSPRHHRMCCSSRKSSSLPRHCHRRRGHQRMCWADYRRRPHTVC